MSSMQYPDFYREPLLPDTIRLLRLLPSEDTTEPIRCELFHYPLKEIDNRTHPYEALSYVWGSSTNPQYVSIREHNSERDHCSTSGNELPVTENLHSALLRLRYRTFERIIWIDAVCINQNNQREKEQQIQVMAKIYALANRVIVWLGEAAEDSDRALHWIRSAGGSQPKIPSSNAADEQAVIALLQRPWFRRIWILQEVAAARHVLIMCGPTEIDGYAFCLGVDLLEELFNAHADLKNLAHSVAYLIRGAIFRPTFSISGSGRSSLDIRPLGELIDMYRAHDATIRHDKLYALLGMSTDDLGQAKLMPDYSLQWEETFKRLVKYLLYEDISVEIEKVDQEFAVIESKGCVLGKVKLDQSKNARGDSGALNITFRNGDDDVSLSLPPSGIFVRDEDIVCLLQGSSTPMIIRQRQDYFEIIAIYFDWSKFTRPSSKVNHDFILVWDWGTFSRKSQYRQRCDQLLRFPTDLEGSLGRLIRIGNVARVLEDAGMDEEARNMFQTHEIGSGLPQTGTAECGLTPLSWAAGNGHDAIVRLLVAKDDVTLDLKDHVTDRTPLSWAAERGHETVVKLLLETGKTDVNSTDEYSTTPLSWAAERGHETVVKLLLETGKAEVNSMDASSRTPLSWAAARGYETVVKLLIETGEADVDSTDYYGRTPLFWAAKGGHETVVKLLLETGRCEVNCKDKSGNAPLSLAVAAGHENVIKLLLETGKVDVNARDKYDQTLLLQAAKAGHETVVKLLLETSKDDVHSRDRWDRTPLYWAAREGHKTVVKLLLETGKVDVNARDQFNQTPLSRAAEEGHEIVVKILRKAGGV